MAPYIYCECCQRDIAVEIPIPQVGDVIQCQCGAELRLINVFFEPVLEAVVQRLPPDFHDDDITPVEIPSKDPKELL